LKEIIKTGPFKKIATNKSCCEKQYPEVL